MTEKLSGPPSSARRSKHRCSSSKQRQRIKRWRQIGSWVLLFLLLAILLRWLGGYRPAPAVYSSHSQHQALVQLPRDDAPHEDYMEWWYYNGHLKADDGRAFSFHYVFFVVNAAVGYTVVHVALTDHQTLKRYSFQKGTTTIAWLTLAYSCANRLRKSMIRRAWPIEVNNSGARRDSADKASPMIVNSRSTAERINRLLR
jgi:hypothetical protein